MNMFRWSGRADVVSPAEVAGQVRQRRDAPPAPVVAAPPVLVHTSQTPTAVEVESAGERVDPEVEERMRRLRERVSASRRSVERVSTAPAAAVDTTITEEDRFETWFQARQRREEQARARRAQEAEQAASRGGPCKFCGVTRSWERVPRRARPVGRWYDSGTVCAVCEQTRTDHGRTRLGDLEHRETVLYELVPRWVRRIWLPGPLAERVRLPWWSESGAGPATRPFEHVDVDAMVAALRPAAPVYETREPCRRCGVADRWATSTVPENMSYVGPAAVQPMTTVTRCAARSAFAYCDPVESFEQFVGRVTGLSAGAIESLGPAVGQVLGVHWWADAPNGGRMVPPRPCDSPYGHVDRQAVCRRALEMFPDPRSWRSMDAMRRAHELADGR